MATTLSAQTQQGYVKTKGRLGNNGSVIAGTRLQGATVSVKGGNSVLSGNNGTFSLSVPNNNYFLQNVQKQGYVLTDPDVLSKQYAYSSNPLVLVLELTNQQADDKLAAEQKIRRTLRRQLQDKEDEIESLKEQQKLTEEEYRKQLQELYAQQESNEKLISEMADRYSRMDFDEVDEFNRRISQFILDGKLTKADSLLNTKGDINSRAAILRQHQEANAHEEQEIKVKQKKLQKSKAMTQKELEDLAQDCYSKFEIFKMQHHNDSAFYYIKLRSDLDATNVKWLMETGDFSRKYFANYTEVLELYKRAYSIATKIDSTDKAMIAYACNNIASTLTAMGEYDKAMCYYNEALGIQTQIGNGISLDLAKTYCDIGVLYYHMNKYDLAEEYMLKDYVITKELLGPNHKEISTSYSNIAQIKFVKGDYDEAINYNNKALTIDINTYGESDVHVATLYNNQGLMFKKKGDETKDSTYYKKALDLYEKSLAIKINCYGEIHPETATSYSNIGGVYEMLNKYDKALEYALKDLNISVQIFGENHPGVATSYNNAGKVYKNLGDYDKSLTYYEKAMKIRESYYPEGSTDLAGSYNNIGMLYYMMKDYENALYYLTKGLEMFRLILGDSHSIVKHVSKNIEKVKTASNKK